MATNNWNAALNLGHTRLTHLPYVFSIWKLNWVQCEWCWRRDHRNEMVKNATILRISYSRRSNSLPSHDVCPKRSHLGIMSCQMIKESGICSKRSTQENIKEMKWDDTYSKFFFHLYFDDIFLCFQERVTKIFDMFVSLPKSQS
jgi:hypothetical protein